MRDPLAIYVSMACGLVAVPGRHAQLGVQNNVLRTIACTERAPNLRVCVDVDGPGFINLWLDRVRHLAETRSLSA
jgi:hypothetical protein